MRALLVAVAAVLAGAAPAAAQDLGLPAATPVAAFGERIAFSLPVPGAFVLASRVADGPVEPLGAFSRATPYDVDLGPDADGEPVAVYSRGGDLFAYDFAAERERRIGGRTAATESDPTIWGERVAFQRRVRGGPARLVVRRGDGTERRIARPGPRGGTASGLELRGRDLAYTWTSPSPSTEGPAVDLHLVRLGGGHRVVDRGGRGGLTSVEPRWPAFAGDRLHWVRTCRGDPSGCTRRSGPRRQRVRGGLIEGVLSPRTALAHDVGTAGVLLLTGSCTLGPPPVGGPCTLSATRPAFAPLPG